MLFRSLRAADDAWYIDLQEIGGGYIAQLEVHYKLNEEVALFTGIQNNVGGFENPRANNILSVVTGVSFLFN